VAAFAGGSSAEGAMPELFEQILGEAAPLTFGREQAVVAAADESGAGALLEEAAQDSTGCKVA